MNKRKFLEELEKRIMFLSAEERKDILYDYNQHFDDGIKEGKSEDEIAASLGSINNIAVQIRADYHIDNASSSEKITFSKVAKAVFAAAALGFFNIIFLLGPFIAVFSVLFALLVTFFSTAIAGLAVFICSFFVFIPAGFIVYIPAGLSFVTLFFAGLGLLFISVFLFYLIFLLAKEFLKVTIKYLQFNVKTIKGGK